ncbi:hypothetical protein [Nocardia sp. XZ_19_385]|uniref:hypothetical protein n=1 Tax=Nocardia sp. XZ_19_385 TaxID=2769488 RepID=UPI00188EB021|nr:hypothetical protein [Nocardia sp. XZ_19_385]
MASTNGPLGVIRQVGGLAFIAGAIWLGISIFAANADPGATPECDGKKMVPGDRCIVYGGGSDSYTYESKLADQRDGKEQGEQHLPLAIALTGIGAVTYGGALAGQRRVSVGG